MYGAVTQTSSKQIILGTSCCVTLLAKKSIKANEFCWEAASLNLGEVSCCHGNRLLQIW